jgi:hypothetical protein
MENLEMMAQWTLLAALACVSGCGSQTIVMYTHVEPWERLTQHRHSDGRIAVGLAMPFRHVTTDRSCGVINHKSPEAVQTHTCLHGVEWGYSYFCGRGIKKQLANGVVLAVGFLIVSDIWRSISWDRVILVFFLLCSPSPHGRLMLIVPEGDIFITATLCRKNSPLQCTSENNISNDRTYPVKIPAPHFITFRLKGTKKTMWNIIPLYIHKALNGIAWKVNNAFRLKNGMLFLEVHNEKQAEVLLKASLLGSYPVNVQR